MCHISAAPAWAHPAGEGQRALLTPDGSVFCAEIQSLTAPVARTDKKSVVHHSMSFCRGQAGLACHAWCVLFSARERTCTDMHRCQAADFSKNGIGLKGITALCEALSHNQTLATLALDTNSVGDEGAEVLARFMASAPLSPPREREQGQEKCWAVAQPGAGHANAGYPSIPVCGGGVEDLARCMAGRQEHFLQFTTQGPTKGQRHARRQISPDSTQWSRLRDGASSSERGACFTDTSRLWCYCSRCSVRIGSCACAGAVVIAKSWQGMPAKHSIPR